MNIADRYTFHIDAYTPETIPMARLASYLGAWPVCLAKKRAFIFRGSSNRDRRGWRARWNTRPPTRFTSALRERHQRMPEPRKAAHIGTSSTCCGKIPQAHD